VSSPRSCLPYIGSGPGKKGASDPESASIRAAQADNHASRREYGGGEKMGEPVNGRALRRGAIFDLDGTLADTAADLLAAANAVLAPAGLPLLDLARDRAHAGRGGRSMIRRSLSLLPEPPEARAVEAMADALYPALLAAYEERLAEETRLFDGVIPCLEVLAAEGWLLGVCTNKPERLALALLERLGVLDRFGAVLGAGSLAVIKPDPEHLRETVRRIGAVPERSVMLGDTRTDVLAARAAGMPCVLMGFGFAAEPLEELAADAVIGHYDELAGVLERLCPRPAETA
jgi:phosphoglycolate phosphatase